nr:hypothetical protein [Tanacetum cinerariifolium]
MEDMQELFPKLFKDVQSIHVDLAEYINSLSWNRPAFYNNDEGDDEDYTIAITPDFSITDSLSMEDEHLSTIPKTESDELIKSSVENLVPNPSESKDLSDIENVLKEIYSNPLFDEEIISIKIDPHHFNEFSDELAHIDLIPPGINETDFDPEEEIRLVERLFDSLVEEIDLFLTLDDSMPLGIKNDDYDSEGDILFLEEFLSNDSPSLLKNESFHFDIPSSPCPLVKPPDDDKIKPNTGLLTVKVVGDVSEH